MTRGATLDALVVDDEPHARSGLRMLLEDDEDITSIREAASGRAAIDAMAARRPDLVLLDVQMPGMSGFDVVDAVGVASMPGVVFVTAHDRYAVRAFEINAIDYLLKPVTASRFAEAMARAKARLRTEEAQSAQLVRPAAHRRRTESVRHPPGGTGRRPDHAHRRRYRGVDEGRGELRRAPRRARHAPGPRAADHALRLAGSRISSSASTARSWWRRA